MGRLTGATTDQAIALGLGLFAAVVLCAAGVIGVSRAVAAEDCGHDEECAPGRCVWSN